MSDEPALLAATLAHPDEDTPRLIYADWLDENGQPDRAEFIRIQCAPDADEAAENRAFDLEERNRAKWLTGLPQFPGARWEFHRGFPEFLDADIDLFLERYDAFARVPWLRFLSLHGVADSPLRDFVNRPWNPQWVELEFEEHLFVGEGLETTLSVRSLVESSRVLQLRLLGLSLNGWLSEDTARSLATSPHLSGLQHLHLVTDETYYPGRNEPFLDPLRERFGDRLVIG